MCYTVSIASHNIYGVIPTLKPMQVPVVLIQVLVVFHGAAPAGELFGPP